MKDVLMMVHTMGNLLPSDNDRYTYLAKMLVSNGAKVEIVTSDFEHHKKKYRNLQLTDGRSYTVTYLHENAYERNISLKRIAGHISFAERLKKYLKQRNKPDVIYCAIPPTISAKVISDYAYRNNVKFVIDVQDLWPESFRIALGNNVVSNAILKPIAYFANKAYERADIIAAVSYTYVNRAANCNNKSKQKLSVYLGTDGNLADEALNSDIKIQKPECEFWLGYVGNIGASYDFLSVFKALQILQKKGIDNIRFVIIGDGNLRDKIQDDAKIYYQNTEITGYLPYNEMMKRLSLCELAINPIIPGTANSVVNKVGDYAAAGVPVINTQDNDEYRNLVDTYKVGLNTVPGNPNDIADKIEELYQNQALRQEMGQNNRRLFEDKFDRARTYGSLVDAILEK